MSRVPWHLFQDPQARTHLVVGAVVQATEPGGGEELRGVQSVLKRLVTNQKPAGDYAATLVRDAVAQRSIWLSRMKATPESSPLP